MILQTQLFPFFVSSSLVLHSGQGAQTEWSIKIAYLYIFISCYRQSAGGLGASEFQYVNTPTLQTIFCCFFSYFEVYLVFTGLGKGKACGNEESLLPLFWWFSRKYSWESWKIRPDFLPSAYPVIKSPRRRNTYAPLVSFHEKEEKSTAFSARVSSVPPSFWSSSKPTRGYSCIVR